MKLKYRKLFPSFFLCLMLIAAMTFMTTGCNGGGTTGISADTSAENATVLGEGSTSFAFEVTDPDGNTTAFEIHTDKETVGEALSELGLVDGDDSEYGLYVKTVNGITVDYDTDGKYWAFYVNGEYATTGVDATPVTADASYAFKAEK